MRSSRARFSAPALPCAAPQELASKLAQQQQPADQLALLHQAAEVYMEASRLQGGQHAAALCECAPLWRGRRRGLRRLGVCAHPDSAPHRTYAPHRLNHCLPACLPACVSPDNWAVALTDIARLVSAAQPEEAYECLTAAASKYAQSLAVAPGNPQANNNWGLVLQVRVLPCCCCCTRACRPCLPACRYRGGWAPAMWSRPGAGGPPPLRTALFC